MAHRYSGEMLNLRLHNNIRCARALALLLALCVLAGCRHRPTVAETGQARAFTDELGREVNIGPSPQRIVSLAPSVTETLFALGLGDRIVGVTSYCDFPEEATAKEKVVL